MQASKILGVAGLVSLLCGACGGTSKAPSDSGCADGQLCCTVNVGPSVTSCVTPENGTCPVGCPLCVCAAADTLVATPDGERAISELRVGDWVYSVHQHATVAVPIRHMNRVRAVNHQVARLTLNTGKQLEISAPHPTTEGRVVGELSVGDSLGASKVVARQVVPYRHSHTHDILPDSDTGYYFAAGAMLASTLFEPPSADRDTDEGDAGKALPACIEVRADPRYGAMGYDHWVVLLNGCPSAADCQVASNVNPKPQAVHVKAGETREVLTFRGSPARTFEPRVTCTLVDKSSPAPSTPAPSTPAPSTPAPSTPAT